MGLTANNGCCALVCCCARVASRSSRPNTSLSALSLPSLSLPQGLSQDVSCKHTMSTAATQKHQRKQVWSARLHKCLLIERATCEWGKRGGRREETKRAGERRACTHTGTGACSHPECLGHTANKRTPAHPTHSPAALPVESVTQYLCCTLSSVGRILIAPCCCCMNSSAAAGDPAASAYTQGWFVCFLTMLAVTAAAAARAGAAGHHHQGAYLPSIARDTINWCNVCG